MTIKLEIGQLTFERIHLSFGFLKELVLRAPPQQANGSGVKALENGAIEPNSNNTTDLPESEMMQELEQARSQLHQRDNEISILVNMVKQAQGVSDGDATDGGVRSEESKHADTQHLGSRSEERREDSRVWSDRSPAAAATMAEPAAVSRPGRGVNAARSLAAAPVRQQPMAIPSFADETEAFKWFAGQHSGAGALQENKEVLRGKYNDAKVTAERVNAARTQIGHLKHKIEELRNERVVHEMMDNETDEHSAEALDLKIKQEEECTAAIEREKAVYKQEYMGLKHLKTEIDHIKHMLAKARGRLQTDFESWYDVMQRSPSTATPTQPTTHPTRQQQQRQQQVLVKQLGADRHSGLTDHSSQIRGDDRVEESKVTSGGIAGGLSDGARMNPDRQHVKSSYGGQQPAAQAESDGHGLDLSTLPLTGNQEADADIIAFYKAKQQLMMRRQTARQVGAQPAQQ
jgi:kinesin family protein 6/9